MIPDERRVRRHIDHIRKRNSASLESTLHESKEFPDYPAQSSTTEVDVLEEVAQPEEGSVLQPMAAQPRRSARNVQPPDYLHYGRNLNQGGRNCNNLNSYLCYFYCGLLYHYWFYGFFLVSYFLLSHTKYIRVATIAFILFFYPISVRHSILQDDDY